MPKIESKFTVNYDRQGTGEPMILIPFISADHACYAFQVPEFSKHFDCISLDLRNTGETGHPTGDYSTETLADDIVDFMDAIGIQSAHMFGLSFGAGVGLWLGAKYPHRVRSLSLHGTWSKTDPHLGAVIRSWQVMAKALGSVHDMAILGILPWCLTPELYATKPEYIEALEAFVRSRPVQSLESFLQQTTAVLNHDVEAQLSRITAPTQLTAGRYDMLTPVPFAERIRRQIRNCELHVFEGCSHAVLFERVEEFNRQVLEFLQGRAAATAA
jgi:pimeloyl-ACP methyl ester carboxylesterase